jgi:tRNA (cmo5U34)-methyltransferase
MDEVPKIRKSTVDEIRERFDKDVERFSDLEIGQTTTVDSPLMLELVTQAAAASNPQARKLLDVGCGAGNYSLKLLDLLPDLDVTLVDLSEPMLARATQRIGARSAGRIHAVQGDIRDLTFPAAHFDVILAAAVLHHLRAADEWQAVFTKFHRVLKPGGSVWIVDLIEQSTQAVQALMWERYGEYLTEFKDEAFREQVFGYIEKEDTPRPLIFQLDLLREVGFEQVELLHKNNLFAAFGGIKSSW